MTAAAADPPQAGSPFYRPDLDGLRAISVLTVMVVHAFPGRLPFGFFSIDVFFVISGYLITTLLLREVDRGGVKIGRFYARRVRRLFPTLLLTLSAILLAGFLLLRIGEFQNLARHVLASLYFVQNFNVASEVGYFDTGARTKPLLHFWTLAVEEQFYIVWPALLLLTGRSRRLSASLLGLVLVGSFALAVSGLIEPDRAYYSPLTRAWVIGAGAALAMVERATPFCFESRRALLARDVGGCLALALLLLSFVWSPVAMRHPGIPTLLPVGATLALIAAGPHGFANTRILGHPAIVWVGLVSYPLYLWHWPLLSFPYIMLGEQPAPAWRLAALLLAVGLAGLTYHFVEQPLRFRWPQRKAVIGLSAGAGALTLITLATLVAHPLVRGPTERAVDRELTGPFWRHTRNKICEQRHGSGYRYFCIQNRIGEPTLVLFGTSFANHFYAGLVDHPVTRGEVILSFGSCEPSGIYPGITADCQRQEAILRSPSVRTALVGSAWPRFDGEGRMIDNSSGAHTGYESYPRADAYYAALLQRLRRVARPGLRLIVMGPKPELGYDAALCHPRPLRGASRDCRMPLGEARVQTDAIFDALRTVVAQVPGAVLIDQRRFLCDGSLCYFTSADGLPLLRDGSGHFSEFGSRLVVERLVAGGMLAAP